MPSKYQTPNIDERKLNMLVQKSNPLLTLCQSDMTLEELKILDIYLAHINSHDESTRDVVFSQGEMEALLGVQRIRATDLRNRLRHLLGTVIDLGNPSSKKELKQVTLFSMAVSKKEQNGRWYVNLRCTDDALKYVFDIETIGYIRYRIRKVVQLKSRYSYVLYMYLLHNAFRVKWTIPIEKLKTILCCEDVARYQEFKYFNRDILQMSHQELTEKKCLVFHYSVVKDWRTAVAIEFHVTDLLDAKTIHSPIELAEIEFTEYEEPEDVDPVLSNFADKMTDLLKEACDNEFSEKEIKYLYALISPLDLQHPNGLEIARYHYLEEMYLKLNTRENVAKRFPYFVTMIKKDIEERKKS